MSVRGWLPPSISCLIQNVWIFLCYKMFICRLDILTALLKLNIHIKSGFHASSFRLCSWMAPFSEAVVGEDCVLHILVLVVEGWQAVLLEGEVAPSEFLSWGFAGRLLANIVCEWCFVCSDEKWLGCTWLYRLWQKLGGHCEVTMLVTQNERGARAQLKRGWGED